MAEATLYGIQEDKCVRPAVTLEGVYTFTDVAAGSFQEQTLDTTSFGTGRFPAAVVMPQSGGGVQDYHFYSYYDVGTDTIKIGVKNNSSSTLVAEYVYVYLIG